jgi:hypothetical protein
MKKMKQDQEESGGKKGVEKRMNGIEKYNIKKRKRVRLYIIFIIVLFGNSLLYNI